MLELHDVRAGYGDAVVLDGISLTVPRNGSVALLGRNGVGKSTLLLTIMGYTRLHGGAIAWQGQDISRLAPHQRARLGIGWVAQEREIFPSLTLEENLSVAARPGPWTLERVYALFPRLKERRANLGNQLSGGEQQMLAIARGLMAKPRLLLLDEPSRGLAPKVIGDLFASLDRLRAESATVLLVDQMAGLALALADRAYVVEDGRIVASGDAREIAADGALEKAYLAVN
jgi:branched-chain amino acid transport system ATP-binding protein